MVHSPTDDLFSSQQWEHWAMLFILVLGLVVGYGQAAAEDRRRAQRRRGGSKAPDQGRRSLRKLSTESRRRPSPHQMKAIAPKLQRNPRSRTAPAQQSAPLYAPKRPLQGKRAVTARRPNPQQPLNIPRP